MGKDSCEVQVKVLSVCKIHEFRGVAIVAAARPKFVVSMILEGSQQEYQPPGSQVSLPVQTVAVFAIDSVVKLFIDSNIVGNTYDLRIDTEVINGIKRFYLRLA